MSLDHSDQSDATSLLQLPDPCLVAVLRCCADQRSVCSAARAHSRLYQAAAEALSFILLRTDKQQTVDGLQLYKHGQHVNHIAIVGDVSCCLRQLLPNLTKISRLYLGFMPLQLQPGGGHPGVLGAPLPLKQLRLHDCRLLDGRAGLAAALLLLPGLNNLSITSSVDAVGRPLAISGDRLLQLPQLTHLDLVGVLIGDPPQRYVDLHQLSALTGLAHLCLSLRNNCRVNARALSAARHLTRLQLEDNSAFADTWIEPVALANKTKLQHLHLSGHPMLDSATEVVQLMSQLQHLQQLTYLILTPQLNMDSVCPSATAYSALTTSSKLQHLDISRLRLPADVWQHVFPTGRRLPSLRKLNVSYARHPTGPAAAPEGTRLVSCCPGLQDLGMSGLQYTAEGVASLQGLSSLTTLHVWGADESVQGLEGLSQLTELRRLRMVSASTAAKKLLLPLTQLQRVITF